MTEEGPIEVVKFRDFMLPISIDPYRIKSISPYITKHGTLYKNVSIINYEDEIMKVLGSVDYLEELKFPPSNFKGFNNGKQTKKRIEDRTQIESKP